MRRMLTPHSILYWISVFLNVLFLSGCTSTVVPQTGPTMEQIYDSVKVESKKSARAEKLEKPQKDEKLQKEQKEQKKADTSAVIQLDGVNQLKVRETYITSRSILADFIKIGNPELKMYVFPHLAQREAIPIPGYFTVFNVYENVSYIPKNQLYRGLN